MLFFVMLTFLFVAHSFNSLMLILIDVTQLLYLSLNTGTSCSPRTTLQFTDADSGWMCGLLTMNAVDFQCRCRHGGVARYMAFSQSSANSSCLPTGPAHCKESFSSYLYLANPESKEERRPFGPDDDKITTRICGHIQMLNAEARSAGPDCFFVLRPFRENGSVILNAK
jgi:hypothetical protein